MVGRAMVLRPVCWVVPPMILGIAASAALSGRDLTAMAGQVEFVSTAVESGQFVLQVLSGLTLLAALATLVIAARRQPSAEYQGGELLLLALMGFLACNTFLPALFGARPAFDHKLLYPPIVFLAIWASRNESLQPMLVAAKWSLFCFLSASLIFAIVAPSHALQPYKTGWVPGLNVRLWGLASNANSIGPTALTALMLELWYPARQKSLRWAGRGIAWAVIVLSQSKTTWIAAILVIGLRTLYTQRHKRTSADALSAWTIRVFVIALVVLAVWIAWGVGFVDAISATGAGESALSLTGRDVIWRVAIREWEVNPILGYGLEMWGPDVRRRYGLPLAFSAHNQLLQCLSVAGIVGLAGLAGYLGTWIAVAGQNAIVSAGASTAFLALLLVRCVTETPLDCRGLLHGDVVMHLIAFAAVTASDVRRTPFASTNNSSAESPKMT